MKKAVLPLFMFLILAGGFVAGSWYTRRATATGSSGGARRVLYYVDPMHPSYKASQPGTAPDCGMQLEPVYADSAGASSGEETGPASPTRGSLRISSEKQQLFGVHTAAVEKASGSYTLRLFGRVTADESRIYRLNSGVDGFIQQASAVTTGSHVTKGQELGEFSSPDFLNPMQAYLFSVNTLDQVKEGGASEAQLEINTANVHQTYDRLQSLGMAGAQIEELARLRRVPRTIKILAPADGFVLLRNVSTGQRFEKGAEWYRIADLNRVWIVADVAGGQAEFIRAGLRAKVTLIDRKMRVAATVGEVLPQFDAASRTLKVRLEADNPGFLLRPDMFAEVELPVTLPPAVAIPSDAVIDTGLKKTVFVELGGGYFEPRQVETGWRFGDRVQIVAGLEAGDRIVTAGNFLLDSETRMKQAGDSMSQPAKDPVCGMDLGAAKTGYESEHGGKHYRFCSSKCQRAFVQEADRYLRQAATSNPTSVHGPS